MMSPGEAEEFAAAHFPKGPEALAAHFGIEVRYTPLVGCDGWCLRTTDRLLVRINSTASEARQRFTLAHELSHVLLGTPPQPAQPESVLLGSQQSEEQAANRLAAELLVPRQWLIEQIAGVLPIDAKKLRDLAKRARVSEIMMACRIATLSVVLGLENGAVVTYQQDRVNWIWSPHLELNEGALLSILERARACAPMVLRQPQPNGSVGTACVLDNPFMTTVFHQILPASRAIPQTSNERIRELQDIVFAGDDGFRNVFQGYFSTILNKAPRTFSAAQAVQAFWDRYGSRMTSGQLARLTSPVGEEYLRLRFEARFPKS